MKKIYIMRHAKAIKEKDNLDDFDRKLSSKGKNDLKKLFEKLKSYSINIEFIYTSPAIRAVKTAKKILKKYALNKTQICKLDLLYKEDLNHLYSFILNLDSDKKEVLLVGHNPTLIKLIERLSSVHLDSFPTSSIICLEFEVEKFSSIQEHSGRVIFFEYKMKK